MIIDFDFLENNLINSFKGGHGVISMKTFCDDNCRIMRQVLGPGVSSGIHTHEHNYEIVFILKGEIEFIYDNIKETAKTGQIHYCPLGHSHYMMNNSNEVAECVAIVIETQ